MHTSKCVRSRNLKNGAAYAQVKLLCHRNKLLDQPIISQSRNFLHLLELIRCLCYILPAERFLFLYDGLDFLISGFSMTSCIPCCTMCFDLLPLHSLSPFIQKYETYYLICVFYCIAIYVSTTTVIPKTNSLCLSVFVINNLLLLVAPTEN